MPKTRVSSDERNKRKRWPREERERFIVEQAAELFAERGFALSTRELASSMNITQALLYQYFGSKQALIDRVFESTFFVPWEADVSEALLDASVPLEERLVTFYERFVRERLTPVRQRLFLRANLDGLDLARRFAMPLDKRVLQPIVAALRQDAGRPAIADTPMTTSERELAMLLHSSIVFLGLRKHVYATRSIGRLETHVRRHVRVFLIGAQATLAEDDV